MRRRRLSLEATVTHRYMVEAAPSRGGFMFEGARPVYERGGYKDAVIDELLAAGAIRPHADPKKGWIPVMDHDAACEDLAELFIDMRRSRLRGFDQVELDAMRHRLALHIQDSIEGWLSAEEIKERKHKPLAKSEQRE